VIGVSLQPGRRLVCRQAVELVTGYLEDALPRAQRRRFEAHLASCADCPEYLAQIRVIIALAGSIAPDDLPPLMRREFIGLYHRWRGDEGAGALAGVGAGRLARSTQLCCFGARSRDVCSWPSLPRTRSVQSVPSQYRCAFPHSGSVYHPARSRASGSGAAK
jgi:anti-sigma factor RsiW